MSCVYCTFGIKGVSIINVNDTPFIRTGRTQDNTRVKMKAGKISLEKKKFLKEDKIFLCSDLVIDSLQDCLQVDLLTQRLPYPAEQPLWGRLLWYSTSSTVQTAPFTFSTLIKHLWRLRLCLTAFYDKNNTLTMKH